jgi:hypothetical protein
MNFYYFNGGNHIESNLIRTLDKIGFTGVLFTYDAMAGDYFTRIARDIKIDEKIIYMVAIRPYIISPQYLTMISLGIERIMPNRLQINLISGHVKPIEQNIGGIIGEVNDQSNHIEKSNYLIQFLKEINKMQKNKTYIHGIDFFVSATNEHTFNTAKALRQKIILPYREYKRGHFLEYSNYGGDGTIWPGESIRLQNTTTMISLSPILRKTKEEITLIQKNIEKEKENNDTDYFTFEEFDQLILELKKQGIDHIMLIPWPEDRELSFVLEYVKEFNQRKKK